MTTTKGEDMNRPTGADGCHLNIVHKVGRARVYENWEWDEYIVAVDGTPWRQWYHTDDLEDAKDTAKEMDEEGHR
jgi:hypothetical protein